MSVLAENTRLNDGTNATAKPMIAIASPTTRDRGPRNTSQASATIEATMTTRTIASTAIASREEKVARPSWIIRPTMPSAT